MITRSYSSCLIRSSIIESSQLYTGMHVSLTTFFLSVSIDAIFLKLSFLSAFSVWWRRCRPLLERCLVNDELFSLLGGGEREGLDLEDTVGRGDRVGKLSGLLGLLELLFFCMVSYSCVEITHW